MDKHGRLWVCRAAGDAGEGRIGTELHRCLKRTGGSLRAVSKQWAHVHLDERGMHSCFLQLGLPRGQVSLGVGRQKTPGPVSGKKPAGVRLRHSPVLPMGARGRIRRQASNGEPSLACWQG